MQALFIFRSVTTGHDHEADMIDRNFLIYALQEKQQQYETRPSRQLEIDIDMIWRELCKTN